MTPPGSRTGFTLVTAAFSEVAAALPEALAAAPVVDTAILLPLVVLEAGTAVFEVADVALSVALLLGEAVSVNIVNIWFLAFRRRA